MANKALIVVDVQNDFCPGGALAVEDGDAVVPVINRLARDFEHLVLTQDWHPAGHSSFASSHPHHGPYDIVDMPYGAQTLWPDHCVQGTRGAEFHADLEWTRAELIIRKGFRPAIDSYSAFFENDHTTATGLGGYLRERGITDITLVGLAADFCVGFSALDAMEQGFTVTVPLEATRGIDIGGSMRSMLERMRAAGVRVL